jgi:hypothetical protein
MARCRLAQVAMKQELHLPRTHTETHGIFKPMKHFRTQDASFLSVNVRDLPCASVAELPFLT